MRTTTRFELAGPGLGLFNKESTNAETLCFGIQMVPEQIGLLTDLTLLYLQDNQ